MLLAVTAKETNTCFNRIHVHHVKGMHALYTSFSIKQQNVQLLFRVTRELSICFDDAFYQELTCKEL